jgi:NitT/TauT family transport system ATP-binding protein
MTDTVAFSVRNLVKEFPGRDGAPPLRVIKGLDLTVRQSEFICILGPSGCGKSTFLNILSGLDRQYGGEIDVGGKTFRGGKPPMRIGYLFQEPRLLPWLTAEQNVDFAMTSCNVAPARRKELKDRYFVLAGLTAFRNHYPHQMSGGMCQRLALVRALCVEPDILLMDEPFSGLDELTARRMRVDLLDIWQKTRKTIIFVTHNSYEACYLSDRILMMSQGEVQEEIPVPIPRPRDYDDPAIFDINRGVVTLFLKVAEAAAPQH